MKSVHIFGALVAAGAAIFGASAVSSLADTTTRDETGQITEAGDLGVYKLQVGDCVNDSDLLSTSGESQEVSGFKAVPCGETHTGEVIGVVDEFYSETEYPGDDAAYNRAMESCVPSLESYTGVDFQDSYFDVYALYPSEDGWKYDNDRGITCVGLTVDADYQPVTSTGSIKAA